MAQISILPSVTQETFCHHALGSGAQGGGALWFPLPPSAAAAALSHLLVPLRAELCRK